MELNEEQFIAGFNSGYLLAQYEQEVLTSLLTQISPVNSYISGMTYGKKEYELTLQTNQLDDLRKIRSKGKDSRESELD
ncbi:MAG: hypothetical protein JPMHGGIA_02446 [Saprospiraceae bacterium]|jgi:hypothetical protein|nr:hypothetical protein [Saprospiraceae bacterium]